MSVPDTTDAYVEVAYSNIGEEWVAELVSNETDKTLAFARAKTRSEAIRALADAIEVA